MQNIKSVEKINVVIPAESSVFYGENSGRHYVSYRSETFGLLNVPVEDEVFMTCLQELNPSLHVCEGLVREVIVKMLESTYPQIDKKTVVNRIIEADGHIYYNLGKDKVAVIEPGKVRVIDEKSLGDKNFAFTTYDFTCYSVMPKESKEIALTQMVRELFCLNSFYGTLMTILLVTMFVPQIVKPILYVKGVSDEEKFWFAQFLQEIIDPLDTDVYPSAEDSDEPYVQRYFHVENDIDDLRWLYDTNLIGETPNGEIMKGMRNAMLVYNADTADFDEKTGAMLVGIEPEVEAVKNWSYGGIVSLRKGNLADMLYKIFKVLCEAMLVKDQFAGEDKGELTQFFQWAKAVSKVLYGSEKVFEKVWAMQKPFGEKQQSVYMDVYGIDKWLEAYESDRIGIQELPNYDVA